MAGVGAFLASQFRWSDHLDRLFPPSFRLDGNTFFLETLVPRFLQPGMRICDVGGGRTPAVAPAERKRLRLDVTGLDLDSQALSDAPPGSWDAVAIGDIASPPALAPFDLVISQAILEHVPDAAAALRGTASLLKPGGTALVFVPSRRALYARVNRLLPESWKRPVLRLIFPQSAARRGFPSHYDRCTPKELAETAAGCGLILRERHLFYKSLYFDFFFPAHLAWRFWVLGDRAVDRVQAAETFILVLGKPVPAKA